MHDKIDRLEDAISAILAKLELPNLESFGISTPIFSKPAPESEKQKPKPIIVKDAEPYQYKALEEDKLEIRVIELDAERDVLSGTVHHVSLENNKTEEVAAWPDPLDPEYMTKLTAALEVMQRPAGPPPYIGLSYTWGEPAMDSAILLDGKKLAITKNLHTALDALRKGGWAKKRWWIDQICA
jgi:hypothetical protein